MTTPEQIEAQASADHERRIEEAERRVIEAGRDLSTAVGNECDVCELYQKVAAIVGAVKALNALTTSVESLPEKVDEWDGWDVYTCGNFNNAVQVVEVDRKQFTRDTTNETCSSWKFWGRQVWDVSAPVFRKLHGPARLEVLKSLPDDLVKAAKGVKS